MKKIYIALGAAVAAAAMFLIVWQMTHPFRTTSNSTTDSITACARQHPRTDSCTYILITQGRLPWSSCSTIGDADLSSHCSMGGFVAQNAFSCSSLPDSRWQRECAAVSHRTVEGCQALEQQTFEGQYPSNFPSGQYWANRCYEDLAKLTGNVHLCDNVHVLKISCYISVGQYFHQSNPCDALTDSLERGQCQINLDTRPG